MTLYESMTLTFASVLVGVYIGRGVYHAGILWQSSFSEDCRAYCLARGAPLAKPHWAWFAIPLIVLTWPLWRLEATGWMFDGFFE